VIEAQVVSGLVHGQPDGIRLRRPDSQYDVRTYKVSSAGSAQVLAGKLAHTAPVANFGGWPYQDQVVIDGQVQSGIHGADGRKQSIGLLRGVVVILVEHEGSKHIAGGEGFAVGNFTQVTI
jgi:hypothetical protein